MAIHAKPLTCREYCSSPTIESKLQAMSTSSLSSPLQNYLKLRNCPVFAQLRLFLHKKQRQIYGTNHAIDEFSSPARAMSSFIDWSKTTKSKDYKGSSSFATFLIIGRKCSIQPEEQRGASPIML